MGFSTFYGFDTSKWQGPITQADLDAARDAGKTFWYFKGGGGDDGNYVDSQFEASLALARANPWLKIGVYWFAGMTDAEGEANYAGANIWSKLLPGEVPILDVDRAVPADPLWSKGFFTVSDARLGIPTSVYMNQSTENSYDWSGMTNRSLFIADYAVSPDGSVGLRNWPFYFGQQYSSTGTIGALSPVDLDAIFVDSLSAWDKIAIQPAPVVAPPAPLSSTTAPSPVAPDPASLPELVVQPSPSPTPVTTPTVTPTPSVGTAIDIVKPKKKLTLYEKLDDLYGKAAGEVTVVENDIERNEDAAVKIINAFKGKKTYTASTLMLLTSVEKYLTGGHDLSQYLTTVQGLFGAMGVLGLTIRAALAKIENKL